MRKTLLLIAVLSSLLSCRVTQESENEAAAGIRMDGVYIAKSNTEVKAGHQGLRILRFYNQGTGVMVPDVAKANLDLENDSIIKLYYKWAQEFELKNPEEKELVNFKYTVVGDSVKFEQRSPEIQYQFAGKLQGDSLMLEQVTMYEGNKAGSSRLYFRFYEVK